MDRLHRKKRSFGDDNLEFWYLTPTLTSASVVAAYKFIHADSEADALKNIADSSKFNLTKKNSPVWNANTGFTLRGSKVGLESDSLRNAVGKGKEKTTIKSAVLRVKLPALTHRESNKVLNIQRLAMPQVQFGLTRGFSHQSDYIGNLFALYTNLSGGASTGCTFNKSDGNWQQNYEYVIICGYKTVSSSNTEANISVSYDNGDAWQFADEVVYRSTLYWNTGWYNNVKYTFMTHYTDSQDYNNQIIFKAACFYNRLLTKQEHKDISRMAWKI